MHKLDEVSAEVGVHGREQASWLDAMLDDVPHELPLVRILLNEVRLS